MDARRAVLAFTWLSLLPLIGAQVPTGAVATVDGASIPLQELRDEFLRSDGQLLLQTLARIHACELQIQKKKLDVSKEEIEDDVQKELDEPPPRDENGRTLPTKAPSKHEGRLRVLLARLHRTEEGKALEADHAFAGALSSKAILADFDLRVFGDDPSPGEGLAFQVQHRSDSDLRGSMSLKDAAVELKNALTPAIVDAARERLITRFLLDRALSAAEVTVTKAETDAWLASTRAKHAAPFTFEQICRLKGTTIPREVERWRLNQAFLRITKTQLTSEDDTVYREANADFFLGAARSISRIVIAATDEVGVPLDLAARAAKNALAEKVHLSAKGGGDFAELARNHSADTESAARGGQMLMYIKAQNSVLDPAATAAIFRAKSEGEIIPLVETRTGFEIIRVDRINKPQSSQNPNWSDPKYAEWLRDENLSAKARAWFAEIRAKAVIELAPMKACLSF